MFNDDRRQILIDALLKNGVELRSDSQLCNSYIEGTLSTDFTPEYIADVCAYHKFLFGYTSYIDDFAQTVPRMTKELEISLGSMDAAQNYIKNHEIPFLKSMAIMKVGGLPSVWPWLLE